MTRFWLIRHAIVDAACRATYYGRRDVALCRESLEREAPRFRALAALLPRGAHWVVSPLSRTRLTARAIQEAGYPETELVVEQGITEQALGEWEGLPHAELAQRLTKAPHPFWPLAAEEEAPGGGEPMQAVIARVGAALEQLAGHAPDRDVVAVSHGGAIRAALGHALGVSGQVVLHFAVQNLSLTCLHREPQGWRVVCVNQHHHPVPEFGFQARTGVSPVGQPG